MNNTNANNSLDGGNLSRTETKAVPRFSHFKCPITNIMPDKVITLYDAYLEIMDIRKQSTTALLRTITCVAKARTFKAQNFNYCTFAGTFTKRKDQSLIKHSNLITLDFDHVTELQALKKALLEDRYFETELLFISPSGDGLKWIVPVNLEEDTHLNWFNSIEAYIKSTYQLKIDPSGKDLSRACFLAYDSQVYINNKYMLP